MLEQQVIYTQILITESKKRHNSYFYFFFFISFFLELNSNLASNRTSNEFYEYYDA